MNNGKMKFNTKYLKTGGYSVIVSLVAIAIVIVLNLFVSQLPSSLTQFDLSKGDILAIGEETEKIVGRIDEEVTIYYVAQYGSEDVQITTVLEKYKELNSKIKIEQVDPALNPGFLTGDKKDVSEGSLVIESAKRTKIVTGTEIFYPGISEDELYYYYAQTGQMPSSTGFGAEQCITSALDYVTTDILPIIYTLSGHGEQELSDTYKTNLKNKSLELKTLNLVSLAAVPDDCDCVLITTPEKDISSDEAEKLLAYLKNGGKLMYVSYFGYTLEAKHTNLSSVLEYYGVTAGEGFIVEGSTENHLTGYPYFLIPNYGEHEIVSALKGYYMVMGYSQPILKKDDARATLTITPLLTTSSKAYTKLDVNAETLEKAEGDTEGAFNIAVMVTEKAENGKETQIIWVNSPALVNESLDYFGANSAMFLNSFNYMCGREESISIPAKQYENTSLSLTEAQSAIWTAIFAVILPVAVVVTGFVVWFRRRRK